MDYQIRIRTDDQFDDCDFFKQWLEECEAGFAFNHNLPDNNHYHIYLFNIQRNQDAMRRHLGKHLPTKECYAVSRTYTDKVSKRKLPISQIGSYIYGTTKELLEPIWSKNVNLEELQPKAELHYNKWRGDSKPPIVSQIINVETRISKPDDTWSRLLEDVIRQPELYEKLSVPQIKSKIAVGYLKKLKAVPRPSDLHRYSISIYYIVKHRLYDDMPIDDDALVAEFNH